MALLLSGALSAWHIIVGALLLPGCYLLGTIIVGGKIEDPIAVFHLKMYICPEMVYS